MNTRRAIILTRNALMGQGLKSLLAEQWGIEAHIVRDLDAAGLSAAAEPTYFFTDEHLLIKHLAFFLPRKAKTVILSDKNDSGSDFMTLNVSNTLTDIITSLSSICADSQSGDTSNNDTPLSQREIDVLRLIAAGRINKEIATELNISINTVLTHRKNITAKLGIKSVSGLTFYAMMNGIA